MDSLKEKQKSLYEEYLPQIRATKDVIEATKIFKEYLIKSTKLNPKFNQLTEEEQKSIIKNLL